MASPKITRTMLYSLKLKFEEDEAQRKFEEGLARERAAAQARAIAELNRQAEERARQEAIRLKTDKMVKDILNATVAAATVGKDTIVVELGDMWQHVFEIVRGIRREIPDICLDVHEYDKSESVGGVFSSKIKSISVSWRPGSGRGYLG